MWESYAIDYRATAWFVVMILIDISIFWMMAKWFWDDWQDFLETLRFYLTPDILSAIRGEWMDDQWHELKLLVYLMLCGSVAVAEYLLYVRFVQ